MTPSRYVPCARGLRSSGRVRLERHPSGAWFTHDGVVLLATMTANSSRVYVVRDTACPVLPAHGRTLAAAVRAFDQEVARRLVLAFRALVTP